LEGGGREVVGAEVPADVGEGMEFGGYSGDSLVRS
jgi:hypothetical protein